MLLPTEPLALEQKIDGINSPGLSVKVAATSKLSISSSHVYVPRFCTFEQHSLQGCFFNMYTYLSVAVQHFVQ